MHAHAHTHAQTHTHTHTHTLRHTQLLSGVFFCSQISGKAAIASKTEKMEDFEVGKVNGTLCSVLVRRDL